MKVVVQRVRSARVLVDGTVVGKISAGLCAFVAIEHHDDEATLGWIAKKLTSLRLFSDPGGKLSHSLSDIHGELLLVSNFTVAGRVAKGTRPDFGRSAPAEQAFTLFGRLVDMLSDAGISVQTGEFGADMTVDVENDGPVTLILERNTDADT